MRIGILGAGIAGLSAAYFLRDHAENLEVLEAATDPGGLARSFRWHGFWCDIAPHRLFTNDVSLLAELERLVPLRRVRRKSRIFIRGKWIRDPVNAAEIVWKFLPHTTLQVISGFLRRPVMPESSFEALVLNQYGHGLNELFFKPYSEKLFGLSANQISPVWGIRKIRVAGLRDLVQRRSRLYFKRFWYPIEGGYGALVNRLYEEVRPRVRLGTRVIALEADDTGNRTGFTCTLEADGNQTTRHYDAVISTVPLPLMLSWLGQSCSLQYRPAKLHYLLLNRPAMSPNHWIYFADSDCILNRVAEFKHFSSCGVPADKTVICCEITRTEEFSHERVVSDLRSAGLIEPSNVVDHLTRDVRFAYPVYDLSFDTHIAQAGDFLSRFPGLFLLGRQAEFRHQDVDEIYDRARSLATRVRSFLQM